MKQLLTKEECCGRIQKMSAHKRQVALPMSGFVFVVFLVLLTILFFK